MSKIVLALFVIVLGIACTSKGQQQEKPGSMQDPKTAAETQTQEYLAAFEKDGVPTLGAVEAAVAKAKKVNTIETWENAARLANSYSNVVDVLNENYLSAYQNLKTKLSKAASANPSIAAVSDEMFSQILTEYGGSVQKHRQVRNDCYFSIAELYLKQGDKASALSYAMTAVKLTGGVGSIERGESLIKKIIEYK